MTFLNQIAFDAKVVENILELTKKVLNLETEVAQIKDFLNKELNSNFAIKFPSELQKKK